MTDKQEKYDEKSFPEGESKRPQEKEIIKAYIQYSKESRYRDGLMHNSYYLILIIIALFVGHILSLNLKSPLYLSEDLYITILAGGIVVFGVGAIMATYNRKKINAEDQRQVLENILDEHYTNTGLLKKYDDGDFGAREKDNPFAMQKTVIHQKKHSVERLFIDLIPIAFIAKLGIGFGIVLTLISAIMVVVLRFNLWP